MLCWLSKSFLDKEVISWEVEKNSLLFQTNIVIKERGNINVNYD